MSLSFRTLAAIFVAIVGIALAFVPPPQPDTPDAEPLSLRGKFVGPTAADDAAKLSGLCESLADCLEWDSVQPKQRIETGMQIEELRIAARELQMKGESIGARQPKVRKAVQEYLDGKAGTSGGPLSPEQRAEWIAAFRVVAKASADAAR